MSGSVASSVHLASAEETALISFLLSVGAFSTRHSSHYSLASHLLGTYGILSDVAAPSSTAVAGGLHSLYGTIRFPCALLDSQSEQQRAAVRRLFGEQAELLAHTFCTINRPYGLEHLDSTTRRLATAARKPEQQPDHEHGRTSLHQPLPATWDDEVEPVSLDAALVQQLRVLDAANMIEQGEEHTTLSRLPTVRAVWKEQLASLSPPLPSPLFCRFFHFVHCGRPLAAAVKLSSATMADFDGFHAQLLALIPPKDGQQLQRRRVSGVRLHSGAGLTGEVQPDEGTDTIDFSVEQLRLLASNAPEEPYELLLLLASSDTK